jgi:hypothetical protein
MWNERGRIFLSIPKFIIFSDFLKLKIEMKYIIEIIY